MIDPTPLASADATPIPQECTAMFTTRSAR